MEQGAFIPPLNSCSNWSDSRPINCSHQLGDPKRPCLRGTYISSVCTGAYLDYDSSSCRICSPKSCLPGYRFVPCSGLSDQDDGRCEACPPETQKCKQGEFFSDECTCTKCATQPSSCSSDPNMKYIGCPGTGTRDDGKCSLQNFECLPACDGINQYESVACNTDTYVQRVCTDCIKKENLPPSGKYMKAPCTLTRQADIRDCTQTASSRCYPGRSFMYNCSKDSDWGCTPCKKVNCNPYMQVIVGCTDGGPYDTDRMCKLKTSFDEPCPEGKSAACLCMACAKQSFVTVCLCAYACVQASTGAREATTRKMSASHAIRHAPAENGRPRPAVATPTGYA